jgi:hypothetical protein
MATRVHRLLEVIEFNTNDTWSQCYEPGKLLQDLYIDVTLPSETHLKSHEGDFIANYHFYQTDRFRGRTTKLPLQLGKASR